jgi:hypothetical protein
MTYISNIPISRPVSIAEVKPDVDMNGFSWSNKYGMFFYVPQTVFSPIKPPVGQ